MQKILLLIVAAAAFATAATIATWLSLRVACDALGEARVQAEQPLRRFEPRQTLAGP